MLCLRLLKKSIDSASLLKTLTWSVALFALLIPAAAVAGPGDKKFGTGAPTVSPPLGSPEVLMCNTRLDSVMAAMKKPGNSQKVTAVSTIIIGGTTGSTAYAEGVLISTGGGFPEVGGGTAGPFFGDSTIGGTSQLGALPDNKVLSSFLLHHKWTAWQGEAQMGIPGPHLWWRGIVVNSCEGDYWTATAGNSTIETSTIAIKLGPVVKSAPIPE